MTWINSDAALEAAARRGATVEQEERAMRLRNRKASTVTLTAVGPAVEARVSDGHGSAPLERIIIAAGEARGWRFTWSAGEGGREREVVFADDVAAADILETVAMELRRVGVGRVIISTPAHEELAFA